MSAPRVLVAGFQHETNTFAPSRADWAAFCDGATFPAYAHGDAMLDRLAGVNLPAAGFVAEARRRGWSVVPSCWAGATPSAHVTADAFERIAGRILQDVAIAQAGGGLDAVYLDLHGAAVAEHVDDCEGELLARIRAAVGPRLPVVASLDLHANVTRRMLAAADALTAYRTYPHVDMADTGRRAAALLDARLRSGERAAPAVARIPFLIPINAQSTMLEPAASVQARRAELERSLGVQLDFAPGFPAADIAECGPVVWGYGKQAAQAVARLAQDIETLAPQWALRLLEAPAAVAEALRIAQRATRPVVVADTQDNPGAGGDSNTTGLLHALLAAGAGRSFAGRVALGLMHDDRAARAAHAAGTGATLHLALGRSVPTFDGRASDPPVERAFTVRALSDGQVRLAGPMMTGVRLALGPCARLEADGVSVLVASGKAQLLDRELYRFLGVTPETAAILVNKSSVHFRADFAPIAERILVAKAAGPMAADPADLPWTRLDPAIRRRPL